MTELEFWGAVYMVLGIFVTIIAFNKNKSE